MRLTPDEIQQSMATCKSYYQSDGLDLATLFPRDPQKTLSKRRNVLRQYEDGRTEAEIAFLCDCSLKFINDTLVGAGIA